jgi:amino acid adenylation domain-containing protein
VTIATTIPALFHAQMRRSPAAPAVTAADCTLTYAELAARANSLARELGDRGVRPGDVVGLCAERSFDLIVAILGILQAGAAYVPLDPDLPAARLSYLVEDSRPALVLAQSACLSHLPADLSPVVIAADPARNGPEPLINRASESGLAYVLYTSGSTGQPKGVMIEHHSLVNRLCWMQEAYHLTAEDNVLQKTPFSFDVSVWELLWPLLFGARLVMARPGGHRDPWYLMEVVQRQAISVLHFIPSMLRPFLATGMIGECDALRLVICSGEALPVDLHNAFLGASRAELHNLYGPTEATIDVTAYPCRTVITEGTVPIGRPIANTRVYVMDEHNRPVPDGVVGELCLAGVQLARGYLNRNALTRERFVSVSTPAGRRERIYKTGDFGRVLPTGDVEYLGRIDEQVKIRGMRVELGEIESTLLARPDVAGAAVVAVPLADRENQLIGFVVPNSGADRAIHDADAGYQFRLTLLDHLVTQLPDYMVPRQLVLVPDLPFTSNGKLDRATLRRQAGTLSDDEEGEAVAPRTDVERLLAAIWSEVLGRAINDVTADFFELGGDSLAAAVMAVQIGTEARRLLGVDLSAETALFLYPTIAALAVEIERLRAAEQPV